MFVLYSDVMLWRNSLSDLPFLQQLTPYFIHFSLSLSAVAIEINLTLIGFWKWESQGYGFAQSHGGASLSYVVTAVRWPCRAVMPVTLDNHFTTCNFRNDSVVVGGRVGGGFTSFAACSCTEWQMRDCACGKWELFVAIRPLLLVVTVGATTVGTQGDWFPQLLGWGTNNVLAP